MQRDATYISTSDDHIVDFSISTCVYNKMECTRCISDEQSGRKDGHRSGVVLTINKSNVVNGEIGHTSESQNSRTIYLCQTKNLSG